MLNISKSNLKPNATCRNANCPHGENGKPKKYYVCRYCDRIASWHSIACSKDCFDEYILQIEKSRNVYKREASIPERTDMNEMQYQILMQTPIQQVKEDTIRDIVDAGYGDVLQENGFATTIEIINEDIDKSIHVNTQSEENIFENKRTRKNKRNIDGN